MRIRTRAQAARLRPVALERARHSRIRVGDEVFFGGLCYGMVRVEHIYDTKPYRVALFSGRSAWFRGPLTHAYPTMAEYEASGVHWSGPPKLKR